MPTVRFELRRDTTANWTAANPVLRPGEPSIEVETRLVKYGDGITPWLDLPYAPVDLPDVLEAYAAGETPSAFTLSIVDAADEEGWREAIGAQEASDKLTALSGVTALADGPHAFPGVTITTVEGLVTSIVLTTPRATSVSVDTSVNPPIVTWQMPDVPGWATARVNRGTTSSVGASVSALPIA
ncbi:hypothetical protein [Novosphingobium sp. AP12]|uniref:hyaluronate lyase N-terminal domain-containing protein n=1 Tax=Novosphingobium sp. AP12 TaxID=1144305 RepID=UPI0002720B01|nr:hypothetical protein [Novosphingobium sp. AP12]EJL23975.1 hypothetical protein PMI02_03895 [Novosphingobium sp. AP12]